MWRKRVLFGGDGTPQAVQEDSHAIYGTRPKQAFWQDRGLMEWERQGNVDHRRHVDIKD